MFIRSTIIKAAVVFVILVILILVIQYYPYTPQQNLSSKQNSITKAISPTIVKKPGWTSQAEQQILNQCPLKDINPGLCTCALTKVEQNYTPIQAMDFYTTYQQTKKIDSALQSILTSCLSGK